ncbi:MAG TPA: hypothetical protein VEK08_04465 [Planctomycetota bacterium]|nr:hypothetical protein [Planctomycetota bacterium]
MRKEPVLKWTSECTYISLAALALLLVMKIVFAVRNTEPLFHLQTNELATTALLRTGRLVNDPSNLGCSFYDSLPSLLSFIETQFLRLTGNINIFLYLLAAVHQLLFVSGIFLIAARVTGSAEGGILGVILCSLGWLTQGTIGYGFSYFSGVVCPGQIFQAPGFLALGLAMHGRWHLAFTVAGLIANFHPVNAVIIGGILILLRLFERPFELRNALFSGALMALAGLPGVIYTMALVPAVSGSVDWANWWKWMEVDKTHHMFPWRQPWQLYGAFAQLGLLAAGCFACWRAGLLESRALRVIVCVTLCAVGGTVLSYITAEHLRHPRLASLMFSRTSVFVVPFVASVFAALVLDLARRDSGRLVPLALFLLVFLVAPTRNWEGETRLLLSAGAAAFALALVPGKAGYAVAVLLPLAAAVFYFRHILDVSLKPIRYVAAAFVLAAIAAGAHAILSRVRPEFTRRLALPAILCLSLAAYAHHMRQWQRIVEELKAEVAYPDFLEAASWVRANTPREAQLLVPPIYSKAEVALERLVLPDTGQIGVSMYNFAGFELDCAALKTIYGVDIKTDEGREIFQHQSPAAVLLTQFCSIDDARLNEIRSQYPRVQYLLEHKERSALLISAPAVYSNSSYVLYDISREITQAQRQTSSVYSLSSDPAAANWKLENSAAAATRSDGGLRLVSARSTYAPQMQSNPISIKAAQRYIVEWDLETIDGSMSIGIFNEPANRFIALRRLDARSARAGRLVFVASVPAVRLVLLNNNSTPRQSTVLIKRLELLEVAAPKGD